MFYGFVEPQQRLNDSILIEADTYRKAVDLFEYNFPDLRSKAGFFVLHLGYTGIICSDVRVMSYLPKRRKSSEDR